MVRYDKKLKIVISVTDPDVSLERITEQMKQNRYLLEHYACDKLLLDNRLLESTLPPADLFQIPTISARHSPSDGKQVAIVFHSDFPDKTNVRFLENVCRNKGIFLRIFFHYDEAVDWLTQT